MTDSHHGAHAEGHAGVHVVPMRVLLLVWGALMVLTWVTVSVTYIDLGNLNIMIALGIAVIKSSMVVLYFMHLRYDNPFNAVIFIASILFVMLFIGFALIDRTEYAPELIPGYAPAMEKVNSTAEGAPAGAAGAAPATSTTGSATPAGAAVSDSTQAGADSGHAATSRPAAADSGTSAATPKTPTGH
jgi:cytochrome c oxidase subunit 4